MTLPEPDSDFVPVPSSILVHSICTQSALQLGAFRVFAEGEQNNFFSAKDGFLCSFVQRFRIYDPKWSIRSLRVTLGRLKYHYQI